MSMRGIDISNHKPNVSIAKVKDSIDFCIMKATGGNHFVDKTCDKFVHDCIKYNIPFGFYHFAGDGKESDAVAEAEYFIENCKNYFGCGIPILDWEVWYDALGNPHCVNAKWVNTFVEYVHAKTGVWPWIYANPSKFNKNKINANCARWIADYPDWTKPSINKDLPACPYATGTTAAWQFASDGQVKGYNGNLDVNIFYGDEVAWAKYALGDQCPKPEPKPEPETDHEVLFENERIKIVLEYK